MNRFFYVKQLQFVGVLIRFIRFINETSIKSECSISVQFFNKIVHHFLSSTYNPQYICFDNYLQLFHLHKLSYLLAWSKNNLLLP